MELTPELIQLILQVGGTPALVGILLWKAWNGTSSRIKAIEDCVNRIDRRLLALEIHADRADERAGSDR